jgi:hypothetical protein
MITAFSIFMAEVLSVLNYQIVNPGLFTKKFGCEQGKLEMAAEGDHGTLSKLCSIQRSAQQNFAEKNAYPNLRK